MLVGRYYRYSQTQQATIVLHYEMGHYFATKLNTLLHDDVDCILIFRNQIEENLQNTHQGVVPAVMIISAKPLQAALLLRFPKNTT
jgi:hypothetical protein